MSSDEEKETSLACNHIKLLIGHCQKMINLAENAAQPPSSAKKLLISGTQCISVLKKTSLKIEDPVAPVNFLDIEDLLYEFSHHSQVFLYEAGMMKVERKGCHEFEITCDTLKSELKKSWNQDRIGMMDLDEESACTDHQETDVAEDQKTGSPIISKRLLKYVKVSPKVDLVQKLECPAPGCDKSFEYLKSLKRHVMTSHGGQEIEIPETMMEVKDNVTCKICWIKHPRDQLNRHLVNTHKIERVHKKGGVFRGWISLDSLLWTPLWLLKDESDPPKEVMVSVKDDCVTLYGIKYRLDLISLNPSPMEKTSETGKNNENLSSPPVPSSPAPPVPSTPSVPSTPLVPAPSSYSSQHSDIAFNKRLRSPIHVARRLNFDTMELSDEFEHPLDENELDTYESEEGGSNEKENKDVLTMSETKSTVEEIKTSKTLLPVLKVKICTIESCKEIRDIGENGDPVDSDNSDVSEYEIDSAHEDYDSTNFTTSRLEFKKMRLSRRDQATPNDRLVEKSGNKEVIKEFENWNKNKAKGHSTLTKIKGHLFYFFDSFLSFNNSRIDDYKLSRYLNPMQKDFLEVPDPTVAGEWLGMISGPSGLENASRQKECLKAHARWREFVSDTLMNMDIGVEAQAFMKRELILKRLVNIADKIRQQKLFATLTKLSDNRRKSQLKAREIVFPSNNFLEAQAATLWFDTATAKCEEEKINKIYEKALSRNIINPKDFDTFALWTRFTLALIDRNRQSVYRFTNVEFYQRCPKWFPTVEDEDEDGSKELTVVERYEKIPEDHNPDIPPVAGAEPSCWVINHSGQHEKMKKSEDASIILTRYSLNICLNYIDLKELVIGTDLDKNAQFFVNSKNESLGDIRNSKNSLLNKLQESVGLVGPSINTFRRASEKVIQESPTLSKIVPDLAGHSKAIGEKHYDRHGSTRRANYICQLEKVQTPKKPSPVPENVQEKRRIRQEKEKEQVINEAKETLFVDKLKKSKTCSFKISPSDRDFMQRFFHNLEGFGNNIKFPDDIKWVKAFYREVDNGEHSEGDRLRRIEESIFIEYAKKEIEKRYGNWKGTKIQNRQSDIIIANFVKNCFRIYEGTTHPQQDKFFAF